MALENGHRLLTEEEYQRIIIEGRAVEVLRLFVKKKPGRRKRYEHLTGAEIAKLYRTHRRQLIEEALAPIPIVDDGGTDDRDACSDHHVNNTTKL